MVGPPQAIDMITILDGYIDEPACLGVPPYVAPLPRYVYGAAKAVNKDTSINYLTIDEYRKGSIAPNIILKDKLVRLASSKLLVMIAGAIVPGKYLRGAPISLRETLEIVGQFDMMKIVGGAAAQQGFGAGLVVQKQLNDKFDIVCTKDTDAGVYDYLTGNSPQHRYRTEAESTSWSVLGTDLIKHHPSYPGPLIVELEAGRGCVRYYTGGCTFCSEPCFGEEPQKL